MAFGIIYNSARISLSERARELATLRVLGFSRGEVGAVLVGELVLLTRSSPCRSASAPSARSSPAASSPSSSTETVRLPLVLTPANYAFAVLVVAAASALSALFAARKLADIDLVSALPRARLTCAFFHEASGPAPSPAAKKNGAPLWRRRLPLVGGALLVALIVVGLWPPAVPVEVAVVTARPARRHGRRRRHDPRAEPLSRLRAGRRPVAAHRLESRGDRRSGQDRACGA